MCVSAPCVCASVCAYKNTVICSICAFINICLLQFWPCTLHRPRLNDTVCVRVCVLVSVCACDCVCKLLNGAMPASAGCRPFGCPRETAREWIRLPQHDTLLLPGTSLILPSLLFCLVSVRQKGLFYLSCKYRSVKPRARCGSA